MTLDGQATAVWLDFTPSTSEIYANHFVFGVGWAPAPEQIVVYDFLDNGSVISASLAVTESGKMSIAWQQLIDLEFSKKVQFWIRDAVL